MERGTSATPPVLGVAGDVVAQTSEGSEKLALDASRGFDKVSNLQHRVCDKAQAYPVSSIVKSSSLKALGDINLFKKDPNRYFYAVGQSLLTY